MNLDLQSDHLGNKCFLCISFFYRSEISWLVIKIQSSESIHTIVDTHCHLKGIVKHHLPQIRNKTLKISLWKETKLSTHQRLIQLNWLWGGQQQSGQQHTRWLRLHHTDWSVKTSVFTEDLIPDSHGLTSPEFTHFLKLNSAPVCYCMLTSNFS